MSRIGNILFRKQFPKGCPSQTEGQAAFLPEVSDSSGLSLTFPVFLNFGERERSGSQDHSRVKWLLLLGKAERKATPLLHDFTPRIGEAQGGLLGLNYARPGPKQQPGGKKGQEEGGRRRTRPAGGGAGRGGGQGGGAREPPGPRRPSWLLGAPGVQGSRPRPRARAGSTHPACVVAAAGARMPGIRHAALCAAAQRLPPPRLPAGTAQGRTTLARGVRARGRRPRRAPLPASAPSYAPPGLWCFLFSGPEEPEVC